MPTLSPPSQTQSSAEHQGTGDASSAPLIAIVHKQLAALESLAAEGRAEATLLHTEIADLSTRLSATTARLARLEGTLASTEHVLVAIRAGLVMISAQQPAQPSTTRPAANGAESRLSVPTPAPVAPTAAPQSGEARIAPTPQPEQPRSEPALASPENTSVARTAPIDSPAPRRERVAPPMPEAQREPERVITSVAPVTTPAAPPQAASAPAPSIPSSPSPQTLEQAIPDAQDTGSRVQRGSTVEVLFDDNTSETYTIVRQGEANRSRNLIGENTPLGQALLGARVGDICRYRVANNPETMVRVGAIA